MKKSTLTSAALAVLAIAALSLSPAQATEGYFSHGYGAVNKSMAGAGVATGFDAMSQATNPAALTLVEPQFTADLSIFSPLRSYEVAGAASGCPFPCFPLAEGSFDSTRNYFFIPSMAGSYDIDDVSNFGWAFYGNGGMNTTWTDPGGPFFGGKTGVDLMQAFLQFTYAREIGSNISIGISPILAVQRFKAQGLGQFAVFSLDPNNLTENGYDISYGGGAKIGAQAELGSGFRVGASYQTRMLMTEFDKYAGLFAEQGDFDIPPALQAGVSFEPTPSVTIALDYKRIFYSDIAAVSNPFSNMIVNGEPLGADDGAGFGWEDINAYKLGVQFEVSPTIAVRAGFAYNDNPIPDSEVVFNILAPGVVKQHYTAGMTWKVSPNHAIIFGAMFAPSNSVTGENPMEAPGQQDITIEMWQWEATAGWTWTF